VALAAMIAAKTVLFNKFIATPPWWLTLELTGAR